jgi:opacity protein-like surface antigen
MSRHYLPAVAFLVTQLTPAYAQDYEITPFVGWRTSSSLEDADTGATIDLKETDSFGIILSMKKSRDTNYDFLFSRQSTELQSSTTPSDNESLRIDYYHLGGTVLYDHDQLHPFVSGGLGATHISPANDNFSSETKFSLSIGGGLKFPLSQNIGLRLEARGYGTVVSSGGTILCSGGCVAKFTGSLFMQFEASAGLSIAF